jgi:hypothetical protein
MGRARYQENKGGILKKLRQNYRAGTVQQKAKKGRQDFDRKVKKCTTKHMKDKPLEEYVPNTFETLEASQHQNKKQRKEAAAAKKQTREKKPSTSPPPPPPPAAAPEMPGGRLARAAGERGRPPPATTNRFACVSLITALCRRRRGGDDPPAVARAVWSGRCRLRARCRCAALLRSSYKQIMCPELAASSGQRKKSHPSPHAELESQKVTK